MSEKKVSNYYQYQGQGGYPVFLKFDNDEVEVLLKDVMAELGLKKLEAKDVKNIPIHKGSTRVLSVSEASPRVAKEINQGAPGLELMGPESISSRGSYNVYKYKGVGMMVFSPVSALWELGLNNPSKFQKEVKIVLVRYLSWAMATQGILGLWAVPVDEGIVVMKPIEAKHEVVFIDLKSMSLLTQDGRQSIKGGMQFMRLDENLRQTSRKMTKEQLVSFLSTHTTYLSYQGLEFHLRDTIYQLIDLFEGVILPTENFKPRVDSQAA